MNHTWGRVSEGTTLEHAKMFYCSRAREGKPYTLRNLKNYFKKNNKIKFNMTVKVQRFEKS